MPRNSKDDATVALVALVARRAELRGTTGQAAVRPAEQPDPDRATQAVPLRERIAQWRADHPLPPPTGLPADKAFYDWLSGEE